MENLATPRSNFGKLTEKELIMLLGITKFLCAIFFHFKELYSIH